MAYHKTKEKYVDTTEVIKYLTRAFNRAVGNSTLGNKATRLVDGRYNPTKLYQVQVDFCYLIDAIQRGPLYISPKITQDTNDMISDIETQ